MSTQRRNNVHLLGRGQTPLLFAHGFGCDQTMWRRLTPAFEADYRIILLDLVGSGRSSAKAYDYQKYGSLRGHADDVLEVLSEFASEPAVFVGHSVSGMIGVLAAIKAPERFACQVMIGPSPCYLNDGDYAGGFSRADLDAMLARLDGNYQAWARAMAPVIMGAPDKPELTEELQQSFCSADPEISKHFARVTFLSDNRADLRHHRTRALILQSAADVIAPPSVGLYLREALTNSRLRMIDNIGHCPHLSAPEAIAEAILKFV